MWRRGAGAVALSSVIHLMAPRAVPSAHTDRFGELAEGVADSEDNTYPMTDMRERPGSVGCRAWLCSVRTARAQAEHDVSGPAAMDAAVNEQPQTPVSRPSPRCRAAASSTVETA